MRARVTLDDSTLSGNTTYDTSVTARRRGPIQLGRHSP